MCDKANHVNRETAVEEMKKALRRDRWKAEKGMKLRVYRCPFCKGWHIGKSHDD